MRVIIFSLTALALLTGCSAVGVAYDAATLPVRVGDTIIKGIF